jgi:hypothetical protein
MFQFAGGHDNGRYLKVVLEKKFFERPAIHAGDRIQPSQNRKPQGMSGPKGLAE